MSDHAVPFVDFMEAALYGPRGFYTGGGSAGRRGDFLTSPEVGPLFGAVVARFLDAEWSRIGQPDEFTFLELGAGPGTLARSILSAEPACRSALNYRAVEISDVQRDRHPDGIESLKTIPHEPFTGVVFANELLDNLPFGLAVFDDGWRAATVVEQADGSFNEQLGECIDPQPKVLPTRAELGARAPLVTRAADLIRQLCDQVERGSVVTIDYCRPTTAELAMRPWRDWLRTYRGHERGAHYLASPGSQDITTDVPIDQLPPVDSFRTQQQWLALHGIDQLVDEGRDYWTAHAARPDVAAMRMRSRVSEAEALTDPSGLGGFAVLEWRV